MASVELLVGLPGSGKTARALEAFRRELSLRQAEGRFGSALWITPTGRCRRQILRSLLGGPLEVCFGARVVTFDEFADGLLRSAPEAVRPLSRIAKRKLLRDLIDDLNRRRKLRHFGPVADTAGFLELCVSFISELKREEVWPEDFSRAWQGTAAGGEPAARGRGGPKNRELFAIYDAYQRRLHAAAGAKPSRDVAAGLYDGEGRFWSARTLMKQGCRGPYRDLSLVVVDGFTDFTRTQYEMLAELAGWAERMLVTLPLDESGRRNDLFAKTLEARDELRNALAGAHQVSECEASGRFGAAALSHLAEQLFANPREVERREQSGEIRVLSCVRRSGEIEEVAKAAKRLLLSGVPAGDIVVAFRSLDGVADLVREVFAAAGLPATVETGPSVAAAGPVRLLLSLLDLEREDWAFPRLSAVLNSVLFRPDRPHVEGGAGARAVAAALRAMNLEGGREVILAALGRRVERGTDRGAAEAAAALAYLQPLSDELAAFRRPATFATWVDELLHVASLLRIAPDAGEPIVGDDGSLAAAERCGWQAFVRLVEEAKKAETLAGGPARPIRLEAFRRQLAELLAGQTCEGDEAEEEGRVRVLAADQVRNLDVPHLFLCGLTESSFPQPGGQGGLIDDSDRQKLNDGGLPVGLRARRGREEMLLFYGVVTRARRSLTLTFASVDEGGQALSPSPYLTAVRDLFTAEALPVEHCGRLNPVPEQAADCVTESDLRAVATHEAVAGRPGLFAAFAAREASAGTARNVAAAAEMTAARFATKGLTGFDGLLSDPRNLKRLRRRFGADHEFSATELEAYVSHPFRYFLSYVLGLEPITDPGPGTDFARRGRVLHAALAAAHRKLAEEVAGTVAADALDQLLREEVQTHHRGGGDSPLHRALQRIEGDVLAKRAVRYVPQWQAYRQSFDGLWDAPPRPTHFEVAFGNPPPEEGEAEWPRRPVVEFGTDEGRVRVRGRIDRIDLGQVGGRQVFNVIDYKLSATPTRFSGDDLAVGRSLQLAVYASAARRLGIVDADLYQLAFWSLSGDGFSSGLAGQRSNRVRPLDAELVVSIDRSLDDVLPRLVESIRSGRFPVAADDPEERFNRDYAAVARTGPFRSVADLLEKHVSTPASSASVDAAG